MKRMTLLTFLLFMTFGCGGKSGKTSTSFSLSLGAISSGAPLSGGVIVRGTSNLGGDFIIASPNSNNVSIPLPNGVWDFRVLGWKNQVNGDMTGDNVCAQSLGVELNGGDTSVNFDLSTANCNTALIADANSYDSGGTGLFRKLEFESCLTVAGITGAADNCDNTSLDKVQGASAFIKVKVRSKGNIPGIPAVELSSGCLNLSTWTGTSGSSFADSKFQNTEIRLPTKTGSNLPFPVEIVNYQKRDCVDTDISYGFPHGLAGLPGNQTASKAFNVGGDRTKVFWADNYIGAADSAFRPISGSGDGDILPFIDCNGSPCHNVGSAAATNEYPRDNIKQTIFDLFGPPDQVDMHNSTPNTDASYTDGNLTITESGTGHDGNNTSVNFIPAGSDSLSITGSGFDVNYTSGSATYQDVVNLVNSQTASHGSVASCSGCAASFSLILNTNLSGGFNDLDYDERHIGALPEIKKLLLGPIGGILHQNGLTSLSDVCTNTGVFNKQIVTEGIVENVSVVLEAGNIAPPAYMTTLTPQNFDRKVTLELDGVPEMAVAFNCPAGDGGTGELEVGWFRQGRTDDNGDIEHTEMFFNHSNTTIAGVESVRYEEKGNGTVDSQEWEYFQKTGNTTFEIFSINYYYNSGSEWLSRISAKATSTSAFKVNQYEVLTGDTKTHFTGNDSATQNPVSSCDFTSFITSGTCSYNTPAEATTLSPTGLASSPDGGTDIIAAPMVFGASATDFSVGSLETLTDLDFTAL